MTDIRLRLVSAVDAVSDALAQDIFALNFVPGTKISETALAEQYGVSRNTVREAIAHLLSSGILVKIPNRGIYVKQISAEDVKEIFHLRKLFETEAIQRIGEMGFIPPTLIEALDSLESVDVQNEWATYVSADSRFHLALVEAVGSERLTRMYATIVSEVKLCISQSQELPEEHTDDASDHRAILQCLDAGQVDKAVSFLDKHLDSAVARFEKAFSVRQTRSGRLRVRKEINPHVLRKSPR